MSETTETAPVGGSAPAPESTEPQPAIDQAPDTGTEQTPQTEQETQRPEADEDERSKAQKRIDRLTREKWEARRQAAALEARLQEIERRQQPPADPNAPITQADIDRLANQRAVELRRVEDFNARCNEVYERGTADDPQFAAALAGFANIGGLPPVLAEAALETDAPHKVLAHLGRNPDEASDLLRLSPVQMAARVAKLASKLAAPAPAAPPPVSKAPPPIRPIVTSGGSGDMEPKDANEWRGWFMRQRMSR